MKKIHDVMLREKNIMNLWSKSYKYLGPFQTKESEISRSQKWAYTWCIQRTERRQVCLGERQGENCRR